MQIGLTLAILLFTVFLLGFIVDPIIDLYAAPLETILDADFWDPATVPDVPSLEQRKSWLEHFVKGLASLGVLSFIKGFLALSPWHWWNTRIYGLTGSGGRSTGRNRVTSIGWVVVLIGVGSFLWVSDVRSVSNYRY